MRDQDTYAGSVALADACASVVHVTPASGRRAARISMRVGSDVRINAGEATVDDIASAHQRCRVGRVLCQSTLREDEAAVHGEAGEADNGHCADAVDQQYLSAALPLSQVFGQTRKPTQDDPSVADVRMRRAMNPNERVEGSVAGTRCPEWLSEQAHYHRARHVGRPIHAATVQDDDVTEQPPNV